MIGATDTDTEVITVNDPNAITISFQDGVTPTSGYEGTRDTKIKADAQDTNFGSDTELEADGSPDYATLLKWDLSSLPASSTVLSAEVTIEIFNTSPDSYEIYEMKQDWVEDEATSWKRAFDEPHLLWGTHAERLAHGFTLLIEGANGLRHAVPHAFSLPERAQPGAVRLRVRHYLDPDSTRVVTSRLYALEYPTA